MLLNLLEWFMDDSSPANWEEVASRWVITAIVIAVLGAGVIFAFKAFRKSMAEIAKKKIWTRGQTWLLILVGIFPIFLTLLAIWYFDDDFSNYAKIGGLLKGTLLAWFLYVLLMAVGHLVSPWRRELI